MIKLNVLTACFCCKLLEYAFLFFLFACEPKNPKSMKGNSLMVTVMKRNIDLSSSAGKKVCISGLVGFGGGAAHKAVKQEI